MAVKRIPPGSVSTYGAIAAKCGIPRHARLVGYALHNTPPGFEIPWHRVINSKGTVSFHRDTAHARTQIARLDKEGVPLVKGRTNLLRYGWPRQFFRKKYSPSR